MQEGEHIHLGKMSGNSQVPLVVHCTTTNTVRKYYDTLFHYVPTVEAIGFIPSAQFVYPLGSRCQILEYPFIIGCHTLETPLQAVMAVKKLQLFHERDLVHGDIRSTNMIVSEDSVIFIDDLVKKESKRYPGTYNHAGIPERHKDAIANRSMQKLHDRFTLYVILSQMHSLCQQISCYARLLLNYWTWINRWKQLLPKYRKQKNKKKDRGVECLPQTLESCSKKCSITHSSCVFLGSNSSSCAIVITTINFMTSCYFSTRHQ